MSVVCCHLFHSKQAIHLTVCSLINAFAVHFTESLIRFPNLEMASLLHCFIRKTTDNDNMFSRLTAKFSHLETGRETGADNYPVTVDRGCQPQWS